MTASSKPTFYISHLILFLSLTASIIIAVFSPQWITTKAGAWTLGILGIIFVVVLLVLTAIASFGDDLEGNTFSELLRASTINTTFYPWALAVYMGRWFHPVDDLQSPLGLAGGAALLMLSTWIMIVVGDIVLRKKGKRIWPWLIVTLGYGMGMLTWPA